jgi:hypothetical protein
MYGFELVDIELTIFQLQVQNGIDAVIVDSVLAIRKGLTEDDEGATVISPGHERVVASPLVTGVESPVMLPQRPATSATAEIPVS